MATGGWVALEDPPHYKGRIFFVPPNEDGVVKYAAKNGPRLMLTPDPEEAWQVWCQREQEFRDKQRLLQDNSNTPPRKRHASIKTPCSSKSHQDHPHKRTQKAQGSSQNGGDAPDKQQQAHKQQQQVFNQPQMQSHLAEIHCQSLPCSDGLEHIPALQQHGCLVEHLTINYVLPQAGQHGPIYQQQPADLIQQMQGVQLRTPAPYTSTQQEASDGDTPRTTSAVPTPPASVPATPADPAPVPPAAAAGPTPPNCHVVAAGQCQQQQQQPTEQCPDVASIHAAQSPQQVAATAESAAECASLRPGQDVVLLCLKESGGMWQSSEQLRLNVVSALGSGGSGEVYCVRLLPSEEAQAQPQCSSSGQQSVAAAGAGVAASSSADGLFALKTVRPHDRLPAEVRQLMPAMPYYLNAYSNLELEHGITSKLAAHGNIANSYAYGHMTYRPHEQRMGELQLPALLLQLARLGSVQQLLQPQAGVPPVPLNAKTAWCVMCDVARGLSALHHKAAVVYEDLKPANIMIMEDEATGTRDYALVDFNSCNSWGADGLVRVGRVGGTVGYMSPEAMAAEPHGVQADSWSLGCLLLALKTGNPPWHHLEGLPEHEASNRRSYVELLACPDYLQQLDGVELSFLARALTHDWRQRPTVRQLLRDDPYLLKGPACVAAELEQQAAKQQALLAQAAVGRQVAAALAS